jgi:uncharacterized LabA/DUF88 family protein
MTAPLYPLVPNVGLGNIRVMIFVDGENLAIRFGAMQRESGRAANAQVKFRPDVYLWNPQLTVLGAVANGGVIRTHYYTAVQADHPTVEEVARELKSHGLDAPRVFKKQKGVRSKRVDITLATEMLMHATRKHYDIGVLVAGDEDYVPLVQAVQSEGRGVHVWSLPSGLSPALVQAADHYVDLSPYVFS